MLQRILTLALAGVFLLAAPAAAQTGYGEEPDSATVSDSTAEPGQTVTVSGECFQPGSTATFSDGQGFQETATANASGVASVSYTVPPGSGPVNMSITGTGCDGEALVLGVVIERVAPAAAGVPLPRTGDDSSIDLGRVGLFLLAAGGATVYAVRRRQTANSAA
jgi:LPXTG-motif cell wall-anchored protein